jgi:hypothetical protein
MMTKQLRRPCHLTNLCKVLIIKQNKIKDAKKERIRIPTRVLRDLAKDGNHPLLGELYSTLKQIRQEQRQQQETQIRTDTKSYRIIARCVSQYSHSCPHYPYKKLV